MFGAFNPFGFGGGNFYNPYGFGRGLPKMASDDADIQVADLDGDGVPDHVVGDPDVLMQELADLCNAGILPPEVCAQAQQIIMAQLSG